MDKTLDFNKFIELVSKELDLKMDSYKDKRVQRRIDSLMRRHNLDNYYNCWQEIINNLEFRQQFLNNFTINTSEFFRNPQSFQYLRDTILPSLLAQKGQIRIWSAACSIGAEPYSIAILLKELEIPTNRFYILATDIDRPILEIARQGLYNEQTLLRADKTILKKYFTKTIEDEYQLASTVKRLVDFKYQDLLKERFIRGWDLIACRNFFIYLTKESKDSLTEGFVEVLNPGGILFLGNTEFIFDPSPFNLKKLEGSFYEKL